MRVSLVQEFASEKRLFEEFRLFTSFIPILRIVQEFATDLHTFQEIPTYSFILTYTQDSAGFCNSFAHFSRNSSYYLCL